MTKKLQRILFASLAYAAVPAFSVADCPPVVPGHDAFEQSQFIIRVANYADPTAVMAMFEQQWPGTVVLDSIPSRNMFLLQPPPSVVDCDIVEALIESWVNPTPSVPDPQRLLSFAELNFEGGSPEGHTGTIFIRTLPAAGPIRYRNQYPIAMLGLPAAHARSTGRGAAVAILDTGVDASHPELSARVLPGFNFVTGTPDTSDFGDGIDNDADEQTDEMVGHGTFLAGIVALTAPDAMILPVTVLDSDGRGNSFRIAQGIFYAIDRGVEVINLSLGSTSDNEVVSDAIDAARHLGIVVVAAAGNRGNADPLQVPPEEFPGASNDLLGVAATDDGDLRAPFSSFNNDLSLCAPGSRQMLPDESADPDRSVFSIVPGGDYAAWEGTSVATAFVSAAAAMVRAQHPEWSARSDTTDDVEDALRQTAVDIYPLNDPALNGMLGNGRLDIGAAVASGPVTPRRGDLNRDGVITLSDLARLLADYGLVHSSADLNADGSVNLTDLSMLLSEFGN